MQGLPCFYSNLGNHTGSFINGFTLSYIEDNEIHQDYMYFLRKVKSLAALGTTVRVRNSTVIPLRFH